MDSASHRSVLFYLIFLDSLRIIFLHTNSEKQMKVHTTPLLEKSNKNLFQDTGSVKTLIISMIALNIFSGYCSYHNTKGNKYFEFVYPAVSVLVGVVSFTKTTSYKIIIFIFCSSVNLLRAYNLQCEKITKLEATNSETALLAAESVATANEAQNAAKEAQDAAKEAKAAATRANDVQIVAQRQLDNASRLLARVEETAENVVAAAGKKQIGAKRAAPEETPEALERISKLEADLRELGNKFHNIYYQPPSLEQFCVGENSPTNESKALINLSASNISMAGNKASENNHINLTKQIFNYLGNQVMYSPLGFFELFKKSFEFSSDLCIDSQLLEKFSFATIKDCIDWNERIFLHDTFSANPFVSHTEVFLIDRKIREAPCQGVKIISCEQDVEEVNQSIKKKTEGLVDQILSEDELNSPVPLCKITHVFTMQSKWDYSTPHVTTKKGNFFDEKSSSPKEVGMMKFSGTNCFHKGKGFQIVRFKYENSCYQYYILPDKVDADFLIEGIDINNIEFKSKAIDVFVPVHSIKSKVDDFHKKLDIDLPLPDKIPGFSESAQVSSSQKCFLKTTQHGTVTGAVTEALIARSMIDERIEFNRPFYGLITTSNGGILMAYKISGNRDSSGVTVNIPNYEDAVKLTEGSEL